MMKKVVGFTLFVLIFVLCSVIDVEATSLSMKDITLECIYSDGGLYTSAYSGVDEETGKDKYMINRTSYNLVGVDTNSSNKGADNHVVNNMFVENRCQENMYSVTLNLTISEDSGDKEVEYDEDQPTTFYKFGSPIAFDDILSPSTLWWRMALVGLPSKEQWEALSSTKDGKKYALVSERYILSSDAPEPNTVVYYKQKAEQYAGKPSYISIMVYDNAVLMKKNDRVTRLQGNYSTYQGITKSNVDELSKKVPEVIYVNNPEPEPVSNSSANVAYKFLANQKIFSVALTDDDGIHTQKYELTDEVPDGDGDRSNALCDEILVNTSPYLKQAIKAMQVLVPLFLIVLTAFDIGKVVLTANIDEELPKRKKVVIVRFVVAIVFFFLPSFIGLFTTWLIDSGAENVDSIEYIDCLFK